MLITDILNAAPRDEERFCATLSLGQIIKHINAYAPGATDVRTFDEEIMWYRNLPDDQKHIVAMDTFTVLGKVKQREAEERRLLGITEKPTEEDAILQAIHEAEVAVLTWKLERTGAEVVAEQYWIGELEGFPI